MKIKSMKELNNPITVRKLLGFKRNDDGTYTTDIKNENGSITCLSGKLNPRPSYQREFVYDDKNQQEVFKTLFRSFPLGTFYWCDNGDGMYEVIDGQQRTLSIINIVNDEVFIEKDGENKFFSDLNESTQDMILDQELNVFVCSGDVSEKMDWFETINIAGKALTSQEIRSAVYSCPFVTDARKWFVSDNGSRPQAVLNDFGKFIKGAVDRQEVLEKVLYWHADAEKCEGDKDGKIRNYLRKRKTSPEKYKDASELWSYYDSVIKWAVMLFKDEKHTDFEKYQQQVEWGLLYNKYHNNSYEPIKMKEAVASLMANPEIDRKQGIYEFVFDGEQKHLSPRAFKDNDKLSKFEEQKHICPLCKKEIKTIKDGHADHILPWSKGGRTEYSNLQVLCVECNLKKSNKENAEVVSEYAFIKSNKE